MEEGIQSNEELAEQFKEMIMGSGRKTAFDNVSAGSEDVQDEDPLGSDFFKAINAFRAARNAGDPQEMARAEENLRNVVRGELTGESA